MNETLYDTLYTLKSSCNSPKSELLRIASHLSEYSEREANKLYKIIGQLEDWQNAGIRP